MIYHIVVGDYAATPLREAIVTEPSMEGEVIVLKDILHVGPLQKVEGQTFSELRSSFWQDVAPGEKPPIEVDDMERILEVSARMFKEPDVQAWFWMAPWPADVCAYHWLIKYLSKHAGRFMLVNIANLPFLDEAGKVYYPKNISGILPRELVKARKLARQVTPAEVEIDGDEWFNIVQTNAGVRIHEGGKKLASKNETHYDEQLLSFCTTDFQKASKVLHQLLTKAVIPTGDLYLGWRLRQLASEGKLEIKGDPLKHFKEWEVRIGNTSAAAAS
jgi:hypothetical protein